MQNIKYNSQIGQDKWVIEEVFKGMTHGYFLDVGAGNGIDLSNTYILEKHFQWDGICIEPNSKSFPLLQESRHCKLSNSFVIKDGGEVEYIEYGDTGAHQDYFSGKLPYGGFSDPDNVPVTTIKLPTESLHTICEKLNAATIIHYMSLDVEGSEFEILSDFFEQSKLKNSKFRIMSLSVEHNFVEPFRGNIRSLLESNDYRYIKELLHDDLYVHESFYPMLSL